MIKSLFSNGTILSASFIILAMIGFFQTVILAKVIGVEGLGALTSVLAVITFVNLVIRIKFIENFLFFLKRDLKNKYILISLVQSTLIFVILLKLISVLVVCALIYFFPSIFGAVKQEYILLFSISFVFGAANTFWEASSRWSERYLELAIFPVIKQTLVLCLIFMFWSANLLSVETCLLSMALAKILCSIFELHRFAHFCNKHLKRKLVTCIINREIDKGFVAKYLRGLLKIYTSSTFLDVCKELDLLMGALYFSNQDLGIYRIARSVFSSIISVSTGFSKTIFKGFLNIGKVAPDIVRQILKVFFTVAVLVFALTNLLGIYLVSFVFGPSFEKSALLLESMSYSLLITLSFFWAQSVLLSQGLYDELLKNSLLASLLGSVMIVFSTFYSSIESIAVSMSAFWAISGALNFLSLFRHIHDSQKTQ